MADEKLPPAEKAEPKNRTLSFRPKDGAMFEFVQALIDKHGTAAKAIEQCVEIAMKRTGDLSQFDTGEVDRLKKEIQSLKDQCKGLIESRTEQTDLPTSGLPVFSEVEQKFLDKLIKEKNTDQPNAVKFCVLYTKKNIILW